jgi:uncharacterized protein YndB with AHSA1/START domain
MTIGETVFSKDTQNKKLTVERAFNAPLSLVWEAWTDAAILDQWWAPKPYRAETKKMEFSVGGSWLYTMIGPKGDNTVCRVSFTAIDPSKSFSSTAVFCDDAGETNNAFPAMYWKVFFSDTNGVTLVRTEISFSTEADMEKLVAMGFREGYTMGLGNLDAYLAGRGK